MSRDIVWIDWAKFIGIFLVVFGHAIQTNLSLGGIKALWDVIYLFHMPLFFILSGYLYNQKRKEPHRVGRQLFFLLFNLLVAYVIYQLIFFPIRFLACLKENHDIVDISSKLIAGIIMGDGYSTPYSYYLCIPCWFIICMIQLKVLFFFVRITLKSSLVLILFSILFLYCRKLFGFDLYFCIDSTIMAVPYFILGYWFKYWNTKRIMINTNIQCIVLTFLCLFCVILIYCWNGAAQMIFPSVGKKMIVNYLGGVLGSFMIIALCKISFLDKVPSVIKDISRNTLFIIVFHWVILTICRYMKIDKMWSTIDNFQIVLLINIAYSVLIFYLSWIVIKILEKRCPLLLGKYKLNSEISHCK